MFLTFHILLKARFILHSGISQKTGGGIFKASDWKPDHLEVMYDKYEEKLLTFIHLEQYQEHFLN